MISTMDKVALESSGSLALKTGFDLGWAPGTATYLVGKGVEGWTGSAPIRRGKVGLLGSHGSHAERGYKDERLITVNGHHVAASRAAAAAFVDDLAAFLGDGTEGIFRVDDADLGSRWAEVYLAASGVDVTWSGGVDVGFQIHMVAVDPRKYGQSLLSPVSGVPVQGTGLVFPLFQSRPIGTGPGRVNRITNPSFETGMTGMAAASGVNSVTTAPGTVVTGTQAHLFTAGSTPTVFTYANQIVTGLTAGEWLTFSVPVRWGSGSRYIRPRIIFYDAGGAILLSVTAASTSFMSAAAGGSKVAVSGLVPAGTALARTYLYLYDDAAASVAPLAGSTFTTDAWMAVTGTSQAAAEAAAASYFDGSSAATLDSSFAWSGTANASTSVETLTVFAGPHGVLDLGSGGYSGKVSMTNAGTADVGAVFTVSGEYVPGFTITQQGSGRRLIYEGSVVAGQTLTLDSNDGTVTMDGYAPREVELTTAEWSRLGRGETGTWLFESPGSVGAKFTVGVTPAWW